MAQSAEQRAGEEGSGLRLAAPRIPEIGQAASGSGAGERLMEAHSGAPRSPTATADWPPALKWMGRLSEFLQRASGPVETFTAMTRQQFSGSREGGLLVQQEHTYRRQATSPLHTPEAQQQQRPASSAIPPVAPLFSASAQQTMDGWASQAPLLYGHAPLAQQEGSDRASSTSIPRELVQEEVRRQVMEAMQVQSAQLEELRRENERLRARQDLEVRMGTHQDDQDLEQHQGDRVDSRQLDMEMFVEFQMRQCPRCFLLRALVFEVTTATGGIGNPLETLVAGMTQIQEVLLKGRSSGEAADYDPSKSVVEFPKLKENSSESGAIDFQDWLYLVEQQVGSMASGAATWWSGMVTAAMTAYGKYQASTPIQRLSISAKMEFLP
ncbi:TSPEAR, partial [Symbiodinium microadriaticum]